MSRCDPMRHCHSGTDGGVTSRKRGRGRSSLNAAAEVACRPDPGHAHEGLANLKPASWASRFTYLNPDLPVPDLDLDSSICETAFIGSYDGLSGGC